MKLNPGLILKALLSWQFSCLQIMYDVSQSYTHVVLVASPLLLGVEDEISLKQRFRVHQATRG